MDATQSDSPEQKIYLEVTPEQFALGYWERHGETLYHHNYRVIRKLKDGNYLVMALASQKFDP